MRTAYYAFLGAVMMSGGCETQPSGNSSGGAPTAEQTPPAPLVVEDTLPQPETSGTEPAAQETVRRRAEVGVGEKGQDIGEGIISTPIKAYFSVKQQIAFNIQIPQAMQLYKATNGYAPKTHEDFMSKIIQANFIRLPELPTGHEYVYDPEKEELMVEQPR